MAGSRLKWKPVHRWCAVLIDTQDIEAMGGASHQGRSHVSDRQCMGAVALPLLECDGNQNGVIHQEPSYVGTSLTCSVWAA